MRKKIIITSFAIGLAVSSLPVSNSSAIEVTNNKLNNIPVAEKNVKAATPQSKELNAKESNVITESNTKENAKVYTFIYDRKAHSCPNLPFPNGYNVSYSINDVVDVNRYEGVATATSTDGTKTIEFHYVLDVKPKLVDLNRVNLHEEFIEGDVSLFHFGRKIRDRIGKAISNQTINASMDSEITYYDIINKKSNKWMTGEPGVYRIDLRIAIDSNYTVEYTPQYIVVLPKPIIKKIKLDYLSVEKKVKTLDKGKRQIVQTGKDGEKILTTTFYYDKATGTFKQNEPVETIAIEPIEEIVEIGTKEAIIEKEKLNEEPKDKAKDKELQKNEKKQETQNVFTKKNPQKESPQKESHKEKIKTKDTVKGKSNYLKKKSMSDIPRTNDINDLDRVYLLMLTSAALVVMLSLKLKKSK